MDTMSSRILYVIEKKNIKKIRLAEALNVSPAFITELCAGRKLPSARTIADICRVCDVNEVWLRTGVGEPFPERTRKDIIDDYFGQISAGKRTDIEQMLIEVMAETSADDWLAIAEVFKKLAEKMNKPDA